ncbi:MAG: tetratricopeptide repeat protein [Candidatus Aminicenantes bacterium]|nr:tetratricopeptide repeat protein [Candidatus Aminicenantes bacterium]MDH5386791.1 tetratricopeptide repeat protein [Candidatus Aminicenantes bacterium]
MSHILWKKCLNLCLLVLFVLSLTVPLSFAQEQTGKGRINGIVVDEKGQPVEGALILVESLKTQTKFQGSSDESGHFAVAGMGTGYWRIIASKKGYTSSSINMNIRQLTKNPPITFTLKKMTGFAALMADEESFQLFDKGNLLIEEEKYDEALGVFDEFKTKYPEIYQVHLNIGTCYLKKGDLDRAEAEFKLVLDKTLETHGDYKADTATSLRAFTGLGELYIQKGDFEKGQEHFAQAVEISPEDEVAAYNVGQVFFSNQRIDEAIKYYELAIQIKQDWSKPYLRLGYAYINKGDFDKALEYLNKFIEMDPENPEVPQTKNMIDTIERIKK